jgi:hypothetical protein
LVAAAALALAACSQSQPVAPPKPAATPLASVARRPGIWKVQMLVTEPSGKRFARAVLFCVGPPWETAYQGDESDRKGCSSFDLARQPNGDVTLHSVCDHAAEGIWTYDQLIQGDLQAKFIQTSTSTVAGAKDPARNGATKGLVILTWQRPCKPSETPGKGLSEKVVTEAGAPTAPIDLDAAELKRWDAAK